MSLRVKSGLNETWCRCHKQAFTWPSQKYSHSSWSRFVFLSSKKNTNIYSYMSWTAGRYRLTRHYSFTTQMLSVQQPASTETRRLESEPARPPAWRRPAAARQPAGRSSSAAPCLPNVPRCLHGLKLLTARSFHKLDKKWQHNRSDALSWPEALRTGV